MRLLYYLFKPVQIFGLVWYFIYWHLKQGYEKSDKWHTDKGFEALANWAKTLKK